MEKKSTLVLAFKAGGGGKIVCTWKEWKKNLSRMLELLHCEQFREKTIGQSE